VFDFTLLGGDFALGITSFHVDAIVDADTASLGGLVPQVRAGPSRADSCRPPLPATRPGSTPAWPGGRCRGASTGNTAFEPDRHNRPLRTPAATRSTSNAPVTRIADPTRDRLPARRMGKPTAFPGVVCRCLCSGV
jgi:hypothetical protein